MKGFILSMVVGIMAMLILHAVDNLTHSYIPEFDEDLCEQICIEEGI